MPVVPEYVMPTTRRKISANQETKKEAQEKIKETEKKLMGEIVSVNSQIEETNSKIKNIVAGGAKWEALGVLNVSYGLIIPLVY